MASAAATPTATAKPWVCSSCGAWNDPARSHCKACDLINLTPATSFTAAHHELVELGLMIGPAGLVIRSDNESDDAPELSILSLKKASSSVGSSLLIHYFFFISLLIWTDTAITRFHWKQLTKFSAIIPCRSSKCLIAELDGEKVFLQIFDAKRLPPNEIEYALARYTKRHANIAPVIGICNDTATPSIIHQYSPDGNLRELPNRVARFQLCCTVSLTFVAAAVATALCLIR
jgi:hypothetical protein